MTRIKLLYTHYKFPYKEIREYLEISWSNYLNHLNVLSNRGYVLLEDEFLEGNKTRVVYLEEKGCFEFEQIGSLLIQLF